MRRCALLLFQFIFLFIIVCNGVPPLKGQAPPFANWLDQAQRDRDWATAAEVAARWLTAEPNRKGLHEHIARARLELGDLKRAEEQLTLWEASLAAPTAESLALRGDLAFANDHHESNKARAFWTQSYASEPSPDIGRKLLNSRLWKADERLLYEQWLLRIAKNHPSTHSLTLAAEAHLRQRDWQALTQTIASLNEIATRSAISTATRLQKTLDRRVLLAGHDQEIINQPSGVAFSKRADFLITRGWNQLALEDTIQALAIAPRSVFPKLIQARCLRAQGHWDQIKTLKVATHKDAIKLNSTQYATLLLLDSQTRQGAIDPQTFKQRARLLLELGQPTLALADLAIYQSSHPKDPEAWVIAGQAQLALREPAEAKEAFLTSRQHDSSHAPAWLGLAEASFLLAEYEMAETCYQWLLDREPSNVQIADSLQLCQSRRQR